MQFVSIGDTDPPPLTMVASRQATVEGRLTLDGEADPDGKGIVVSAHPADVDYSPVAGAFLLSLGATSSSAASTLEGGRFRVVGVTGPTRLTVNTPSCDDCFVSSIQVNGTDATDRPFDFGIRGGVHRDVDIIVSDAGAAVDGRVTDERDQRVVMFSAVVFSTSADLWYPRSRHVKMRPSEADGTFAVKGLPPGEYFVAAVNRAGVEAHDPELLEWLSLRAQRITVGEREHKSLSLRLTRR
jgi:hypothetical protein